MEICQGLSHRISAAASRVNAKASKVLDISVVVCTRNRAAQLADALPHFARLQSEASWEIVFVDNGSTDASPGLLDAFAKSSGLNIRVVEEPRAGLSVARNAGWRSAGGSVVAFTDDDCYPAPDHIERLRRCFSDADLGYLGGRVLRFDPADCLLSIQPLDRRVDIPPRSFVAPGFILGANLAFRREILERLDGFDEKLGAGRLYGGEDDDIVARASALGITGAYHPGPTVFHHHRRSQPEQVKPMLAGFDMARGAFYAKMLANRPTRRIYLWPALRRTAGSIWRRDFAVMARELRGAWRYFVG